MDDRLIHSLEALLETRTTTLKEKLAEAQKCKRILARAAASGKLTFKVVLVSLWADEGEKSVVLVEQDELGSVMEKAIAQFMKVNNRSDVQANYSVYVLIKDRKKDLLNLPVPEEFWSGFRYKHA